ncbi:MAG TPA: ABC transporter ATP-binding protein [Acidimicrobiales bacterium]|jgi:branched-chain amino acid transport system ATP-binding protein
MSPLLDVRGLRAGYAGTAVVRDLSLTVEPGEIVALLGPNGAGKTTTLSTVAGLLPALAGEVHLDGSPVDSGAPHRNARSGLGYVTEDRALFGGLSVRDNLWLAAGDRRTRRARRDRLRRGDDLADGTRYFPALAPLADRQAGLLSGGEQQMLAIARALAGRPRLLIVDEMSLGLAPKIVDQLATVLRQVADDLGTGVLLVEQHVPVALSIADAAVVLVHGEVVARGPAATLAEHPDLLQASYLGA